MLNSRRLYLDKRGFTLIELLVGIPLICMVILTLYCLLYFTENIRDKGDDIDTALYNGRYAMELIKTEVDSADRIVSSSEFKDFNLTYPLNMGFVLIKEEITYNDKYKISEVNYNYITYYQKEGELRRAAYNSPNMSLYDVEKFSGNNQICDGFIDLKDSYYDIENNLIRLSLNLKQGDGVLNLENIIRPRCLVE